MTNTLKAQIAHFFRPPVEPPPTGSTPEGVSTLYLLRREIQDCLFGSVTDERRALAQPERHRLFASVMVIFSGIDLLARFAFNNKRGTGARFRAFLERFGTVEGRPIASTEAEAIWWYRNALMHSFGFHFEKEGRVVPLYMYQADRPDPVVRQRGDGWELSVDDLFAAFVLSVERYEESLKQDEELQSHFQAAFGTHGTIHMRGAHIA